MNFLTNQKRARGLGSAHSGTEHFIAQRLSAVVLVPLIIISLLALGPYIGAPIEEVRAAFANFWRSGIAIATIIVVAMHLAQGLQVVIEDYISAKWLRTLALVEMKAGIALLAFFGVWAVASMALG